MSNQNLEVLPEVQSMPTTGWLCQTGGNARRRVTPNTSVTATEGIYDVKGVPGFTHNSSAVVSVDADYTRYRDSLINVATNVWNVGELVLPVGLLTDSEEPDNANERYDRAIEKCVGYISLFPENCTGHIREPTRSIGEIRTLVAPKTRLETLTYIDEMGGWRIPVGATDATSTRDALVSDFPDIKVSMLPRTNLKTATKDKEVSPSSLYIDISDSVANLRYRVSPLKYYFGGIYEEQKHTVGWKASKYVAFKAIEGTMQATYAVVLAALTAALAANEAALGAAYDAAAYQQLVVAYWAAIAANAVAAANVAKASKEAAWDGCITFSWDPDKRVYRTKNETTVVVCNTRGVYKTTDGGHNAGGNANAIHYHGYSPDPLDVTKRLTITFPIMETTQAFDGYCWLSSLQNEDALGYVSRRTGLSIAKKINVNLVGAKTLGPFSWVGTPALRFPVGGQFAIPGPDILQEQFGDGTANDVQHNFYDKFKAYTSEGLLRYHYKQQTAAIALGAANAALPLVAANVVNAAAAASQRALNFKTRSTRDNSGLFLPRLGGFQKQLCDKQVLIDFDKAVVEPYAFFAAAPGAGSIITSGIRTVNHSFRSPATVLAHATNRNTHYSGPGGQLPLKQAEVLLSRQTISNLIVVGGEPLEVERARLIVLEEELESTQEIASDYQKYLAQATLQSADAAFEWINPFLPDTDDVGGQPGRAAVLNNTGTNFAGSCTFAFPSAQFTHATSYWTVADVATNVRAHNMVRVQCTPYMFAARNTSSLQIRRTNLTTGTARFIAGGVGCFMDIDHLQGGVVTCKFDFTDTIPSTLRGYSTTDTDLGHKFFAAGYSFYLADVEGQNSNIADSYFLDPTLGAGAAGLRTIYGATFAIGNKFNVPRANVTYAAGVLKLTNHLFATAKKVAGLVFVGPTIAGRKTMFIVKNPNTSATIRYANNGAHNSTNETVEISLGIPHTVVANHLAGETALLQATFDAIENIANPDVDSPYEMYILNADTTEQTQIFGAGPFLEEEAMVQSRGAVFQSIKRISQHVCGPVLNPNARIGAVSPLNYDSRHLPPELRDFRLQFYDIDWSRLQATKTTLNEIVLYQFKDGMQKVGAQPNVLYLPQFRETKVDVAGGAFEVEIFSELGAPSYFCLFCRYASTDILQQPQIRTLSIFNSTTKKKSNVVTDLDISQLYHLTQRNVHPDAQYDKHAFKRRQTVLLSTEDIGLLGLNHNQYQKAKRVRYIFSGTTDDPCQLNVVMVYNNRGLHIDGRRLQVVTLHE
jgi:hypothetical protein